MEENKKGNSFLVTFFAALLVGALGIVLGYNINSKTTNTSKKSCDSEEKLEKASKDSYSFNIFDGTTPGRTYIGSINLKTGEVSIFDRKGCTTAECVKGEAPVAQDDNKIDGKLNTKDLNKVIKYLEDKNYPTDTTATTEKGKDSLNVILFTLYKIEAADNNEIAEDYLK